MQYELMKYNLLEVITLQSFYYYTSQRFFLAKPRNLKETKTHLKYFLTSSNPNSKTTLVRSCFKCGHVMKYEFLNTEIGC